MKIRQFRYSSDNLGYLVYGKKSALAIDGGAVEPILSFVGSYGLTLEFVANTHFHSDHTMGTRILLNRSGAKYLENKYLCERGTIEMEGENIQAYHTPGHTTDSVCFHIGNALITGDTLFNGTVGNCFSGDLRGFYNSVRKLMAFPGETVIYAGHDYVEASMMFAKNLEPDNKDIDLFLKAYARDHVCSTLADEFRINPYLRFNDEKIVSMLRQRGLPTETEYDRWESMMSIE